ncbi:MAG: tetratricopeptide repeat protein [Flavobacteriia bacterium]|nr:tetratricopeptide repeat protein [Flavobacteriia bacterium]
MGLFDFFNKHKNVITDDGLNLIYSNDNNYLLYAYNKHEGKIEGLLQVFHNPNVSRYNPNYERNSRVGLVFQEYFFSEGIQNGVFKEFNENGELVIYRENLKSDFLDFNNPIWSNKMQTRLIVTDNLEISGKLNKYYKNGIIKAEENYIHGKLVNVKQYYENGQLNIEKCKDGDHWKEHIEYYINGNIKTKKYQGFYINNVFFDNMIWYNADGTVMNGEQIIKLGETEIKGKFIRYNVSKPMAYSETTYYLFINQILFYYIRSGSSYKSNSELSLYNGIYEGMHFVNGRNIDSNNKLSAVEFYETGIEKDLNSDYEGAIIDFTKSIEIDGKYIDAYRGRAMAKWWMRDYEGAIIDYTKIIDLNSEDSDAHESRGRAKASLKDYEGAIEDFNKAIELDKESKVYSSRGRMKKNLLDYNGALQDYNIAVEKYPEDESSYFGRGELKYVMADYLGAIFDFNKCIEIKPNRINFIDKRADCRLKIEDYTGAIEDYSMSIQNRQDKYGVDRPPSENATKILASLYHNRGIARSKIKEYREAISDFKNAMELNTKCVDDVKVDLEMAIKQLG